ncbi:hypothetical protein RND71_028945 [Anisodus tanguticus]|uniref:Pectate lyase n=1 Tax=Anisodus tanguticus TaxID=243964 RepID=A0AAE1RLX5_9SOLA|nr:hypothetical protein RND71_028945 [Anisodus tanguticus]
MFNGQSNRRLLAVRPKLGQQPPAVGGLRHRVRSRCGRRERRPVLPGLRSLRPRHREPDPGHPPARGDPGRTSLDHLRRRHDHNAQTRAHDQQLQDNRRTWHECPRNSNIRQSPTQVGWRGMSDGDGISIYSSRNIWIDHCALSHCTDGLIDAIMGSTAITISNSYFTHHDKVMLLGHDDRYVADVGMQVTIAFNHFGQGLVQRMPRCRRGYIHVVNNDFTEWQMYAIGGSANPTINCQGNRFTAPEDPNAKEVTKRVDVDERDWTQWNWRTEGDEMVNGAYFVPSGDGLSNQYALASSMEPKSAFFIDQLIMNAGVLGVPRDTSVAMSYGGRTRTTVGTNRNGGARPKEDDGDFLEKVFGTAASTGTSSSSPSTTTILSSLLILYITTNNGGLLTLPLLLFIIVI